MKSEPTRGASCHHAAHTITQQRTKGEENVEESHGVFPSERNLSRAPCEMVQKVPKCKKSGGKKRKMQQTPKDALGERVRKREAEAGKELDRKETFEIP